MKKYRAGRVPDARMDKTRACLRRGAVRATTRGGKVFGDPVRGCAARDGFDVYITAAHGAMPLSQDCLDIFQ